MNIDPKIDILLLYKWDKQSRCGFDLLTYNQYTH